MVDTINRFSIGKPIEKWVREKEIGIIELKHNNNNLKWIMTFIVRSNAFLRKEEIPYC